MDLKKGDIVFFNKAASSTGFSDSGECRIVSQQGPDTYKIKLIGSGFTLTAHASCLSPKMELGKRSRKQIVAMDSDNHLATRRASKNDEEEDDDDSDDLFEDDENYQLRNAAKEKAKQKSAPVFVLDEPGKTQTGQSWFILAQCR